jgi:prolyl 4-hydroxylase
MQQMQPLSTAWRDWVLHNLARGCTQPSLVEAMARQNLDPEFARAAVAGLAAQSISNRAPPAARCTPYSYETPRLPPGNVIHTLDRDVPVLLRVGKPVVALLGDVLSAPECDELIRRSRDKLQRSTTVDPLRGSYEVIAARSSEGTFFPLNADDFIARIDRRVAELMNCPVDHGEGLQVLHYAAGGEYRPHFDYFPPADPGSQQALAVGGQRISTLIMYLNAVEQGGATIFPELDMEVLPQPGSALYFEYTNSQGQVDPRTLHGGAPVTAGERWIVTKWMRERRYAVAPPAPPSGT